MVEEMRATDMSIITASDYLTPSILADSALELTRVRLVGNCIFDEWRDVLAELQPGVQIDHFIFNEALPEQPGQHPYDVRIIQVPFRIVHSEWRAMLLQQTDLVGHEQAFAVSLELLRAFIDRAGPPAPDRPTFFMNYLVPQQNAYGRLLPRYDLRNPVYYVERLNEELSRLADAYPGGYLLDADQVSATLGRRFCQDDAFWVTAHGGLIHESDWSTDKDRLEPSAPLSARYPINTRAYVGAVWCEAAAMLRTIRGLDRVKMVCVDLDDTLWRGVLAEQSSVDLGLVEGWPLGFAEALAVLGQRGVILAIVSRNDEARIREIWPDVYGARFPLETFAIRKINWGDKATSLREAIAEANVLPDSVLFIDDNPVERAHAEAALPGLRTLGAPHLDWRRILLWSPETQIAALSDESARRNQMVAGQVVRNAQRTQMSREAFLHHLGLAIDLETIHSVDALRFARALELINKTNQFNTTGQRWSHGEAEHLFATGGVWIVFSVRDKYVQYGLVGVIVLSGDHMLQYAMSCRVLGLEVEDAVLHELASKRGPTLKASLVETPKNGPCRNVFQNAGWEREGDLWIAKPSTRDRFHIEVCWANPEET